MTQPHGYWEKDALLPFSPLSSACFAISTAIEPTVINMSTPFSAIISPV